MQVHCPRSFLSALPLMAAVLAMVTSQAAAQQFPQPAPTSGGNGCHTTLSSGSKANLVKICITSHGNLTLFKSPAGVEHIRVGTTYEGYLLCTPSGSAIDGAAVTSGFLEPAITQPGGSNTLPLTIQRSTADGALQFTQTFAFDPDSKSLTIDMQVKNLLGTPLSKVGLVRFVDGDVDGLTTNTGVRTKDTVLLLNDGTGDGLLLTAATSDMPHYTQVLNFPDFASLLTQCDAFTEPTPAVADLVGRVGYDLGRLEGNETKSVSVTYRRF
jgi:hypothetical protein